MARKHKEKNKLFSGRNLIAFFIVATMIFSVIGLMWDSGVNSESSVQYNKQTFDLINGLWVTKINKKEIKFYYNPGSVEYINVSAEIIDFLNNSKSISFTYNQTGRYKSDAALVEFDLGPKLWDNFQIFLEKGLIEPNEYGIPVVTCENTGNKSVLYFMESNETSITLRGKCIIAQARFGTDFYALNDRLLYGLYGIIK